MTVVGSLSDAIDRATELAGAGGAVLATGSVTTAAEVRLTLGAAGS